MTNRPRLTVRELVGLVAIAALVLTLILSGWAEYRRARPLRGTRFEPRRIELGLRRMNQFLGPTGPEILDRAGAAEYLAVATKPGEVGTDADIKPTGQAVSPDALRAVAESLLDPQNYLVGGFADDSDPAAGLRIRRGSNTLDILWFTAGGGPTGHQQIWVRLRDASGRVVHGEGSTCFASARLGVALSAARPSDGGGPRDAAGLSPDRPAP